MEYYRPIYGTCYSYLVEKEGKGWTFSLLKDGSTRAVSGGGNYRTFNLARNDALWAAHVMQRTIDRHQ